LHCICSKHCTIYVQFHWRLKKGIQFSSIEATAEAEAKASRNKGKDSRRFADCHPSRIQGKAGEEKMAAAETDAKAKGEEARLAIEVEANEGEGRSS
jgi:hypothetical protein